MEQVSPLQEQEQVAEGEGQVGEVEQMALGEVLFSSQLEGELPQALVEVSGNLTGSFLLLKYLILKSLELQPSSSCHQS